MQSLLDWASQHAGLLFVAVVATSLLSGYLYWRQRPDAELAAPVALLRKRSAALIALMTAALFGGLAMAIEADGRLVAFDHQISDQIRNGIGPSMLDLLAVLTHLGDSKGLVIASAVIALVLLALGQRLLAIGWCLSLLGNGLLIRIGKDLFQRVRPLHDHGIVVETGYSFPSGHAAGSLMFYGMLTYVLASLLPAKWHKPLLAAAIVVVLMIGASRILLQVHFVSDVCAGFALGIGWLALSVAAIEFLRSSRRGSDRFSVHANRPL